MILPTYVAHAAWGSTAQRRQVALALRQGDDTYAVVALAPIEARAFAQGYLREALHAGGLGHGQVLAGFDFPIGLPRSYAEQAGISSFRAFLPELGRGAWGQFHVPATKVDEISLERPFYPARSAGASQEHLFDTLGMTREQLCRRCEGDETGVMFWTGAGGAMGRAALSGSSALAASETQSFRLWPFDGSLATLLDGDHTRVVACEAHSLEFYRQVDLDPTPAGTRRNRSHADRLNSAPQLLSWASTLGIAWEPRLRQRVTSGFALGPKGNDELDAVVGLLGILGVVTGALASAEPTDDPAVRDVEGWILGREPAPQRSASTR